MRKLALLLALNLTAGISYGTIVVSDDFSSYGPGVNIDGPWSVTWRSNPGMESQQNLMTQSAAGEYMVYDTATAFHQYYGTHKTGFTLAPGQTATVSSDFRYLHVGGGNPPSVNKVAVGLYIDTTENWWDGAKDYVTLSNRGGALGNTLPINPWIENWQGHGVFGVDPVAGGLSDWIHVENVLTHDGTTVWMEGRWSVGGSSVLTTTLLDTGLGAGTHTLYAGLGTPWTLGGGDAAAAPYPSNNETPVEAFSYFSEVHADNFQVDVIPEPGSLALVALGLAGLFCRRWRR